MLVSEENILEIIPQRPPMVMVGSLVSCDERNVVSQLKIRQGNYFLRDGGFTGAGMIEAMAQAVAARAGYLIKSLPGGKNKKMPVGVIGSIKNFRLYFQPDTGSLIETTVSIEHEVLNASVVHGHVAVDGKPAAESDLQIFITEDQAG